MSNSETLPIDLETARMRYAWVRSEIERNGNTPALTKYRAEARGEVRALTARTRRVAKRPRTEETV